MPNITISKDLKQKCPQLALGCIHCAVKIVAHRADLWTEIQTNVNKIAAKWALSDINQLPNIAAARTAYKALGKDPSRYRLSAEALLRRVVKGKGIYQINNVVDLLNLTSIRTGYSIGGYDADAIEGAITVGIAQEGEPYEAIGRGALNIAYLPTFRDEKGAFGTPTSDSARTCVQLTTQHFLMAIVDFEKQISLQKSINDAVLLLEKYADATNIQTWIVH